MFKNQKREGGKAKRAAGIQNSDHVSILPIWTSYEGSQVIAHSCPRVAAVKFDGLQSDSRKRRKRWKMMKDIHPSKIMMEVINHIYFGSYCSLHS